MPTLPQSKFWQRRDNPGVEHALIDTRSGLYARGVQVAVDPIPYTCSYELQTDEKWVTRRFEVTTEGPGWRRSLRLELAADRWRATTTEQGNLDAVLSASGHASGALPGTEDPDLLYGAFDVDLTGSPLTNTLPIRRLHLLSAQPGVAHRVSVAWVVVPTLEVVQADQIYTLVSEGVVRFANETFSADIVVDDDGFVADYPTLAQLVS